MVPTLATIARPCSGRLAAGFMRMAGKLSPWMICVAAVAFYCFIGSGGRWTEWFRSSAFYHEQAAGFCSGHLYSSAKPHPTLLTLANPLDRENSQYWNWDYSFYEGHLYLYWGLLPAALLAFLQCGLGISWIVGDEYLTVIFLALRLPITWLLLRELANRIQPAPPGWAVPLSLAVAAGCNPVLFVASRGAVYEAAIGGGVLFTTLAWYCVARVVARPAALYRWLAGAGLSLGLAGTCRASLLPAGALAVMLVTLLSCPVGLKSWAALRPLLLGAAAAGAPFAVVAGVHLLVNHLRFGDWTEFGVRYQMGLTVDVSPAYILPNLWQYLVHPLHGLCRFPFLEAKWHQELRPHMPSWLPSPPGHYAYEPVTGLLFGFPFGYLLLLGPLLRWVHVLRAKAKGVVGQSVAGAAVAKVVVARFSGIVIPVTAVAALPVLCLFAFCMRYEMDVLPGLVCLAAVAGWRALGLPGRAWRAATRILFVTLSVGSIVIGALMGFSGYFARFEFQNPALMKQLGDAFNFCGL
jgi:hypothetical protein